MLNANPLDNIRNTRQIASVYLRGAHAQPRRAGVGVEEDEHVAIADRALRLSVEQQLFVYANAVLFTLAALLPIVNPLGSAPIFFSMTADLPGTARRRLAVVVARYAFLLLTAAMLIGSYVLKLFGVSLPIVRVGGGLLVAASGWRLLNDDGKPSNEPAAGRRVGAGSRTARVLPADVSADGGSGIDLDRDHARRAHAEPRGVEYRRALR